MDGILDLAHVIASNIWIYGVTFLAILSVLVFVHEWGHYIVARLCGVRVETFSIGFGKEIWGFNDKHGTRWKIALIPLGGYVKMYGDQDPASAGHSDEVDASDGSKRKMNDEEKKLAFFSKSIPQRSAIVFAGPAINFIFAILILAFVYGTYGRPVTPPVSSAIAVESAAYKAGFLPHDEVIAIDGKNVDSFDDIRRAVMIALDTPMVFDVKRGEDMVSITVTPEKKQDEDRFGFKHERGYLGFIGPADGLDLKSVTAVNGVETETLDAAKMAIAGNYDRPLTLTMKNIQDPKAQPQDMMVNIPSSLNEDLGKTETQKIVLGVKPGDTVLHFTPVKAMTEAMAQTWYITTDTLQALGQMVTGTRSAQELGGIIRIGAIAGTMAEQGWIAILTFTALLSINLGLINLFPIPMLDGGHLTMYAIEAVKGSPLSDQTQEYAFRFGFVILIALMVFANLNDLLQLIL